MYLGNSVCYLQLFHIAESITVHVSGAVQASAAVYICVMVFDKVDGAQSTPRFDRTEQRHVVKPNPMRDIATRPRWRSDPSSLATGLSMAEATAADKWERSLHKDGGSLAASSMALGSTRLRYPGLNPRSRVILVIDLDAPNYLVLRPGSINQSINLIGLGPPAL